MCYRWLERNYLVHRKPKIVIWFYFEGNDLDDLSYELETPVLVRTLFEREFRQGLALRQAEINHNLIAFSNEYIELEKSNERHHSRRGIRQSVRNISTLYNLRTAVSGVVFGNIEQKNSIRSACGNHTADELTVNPVLYARMITPYLNKKDEPKPI